MAFPFFPTAYSEPTALKDEYLRSHRCDQHAPPALSGVVNLKEPASLSFREDSTLYLESFEASANSVVQEATEEDL